MKRSLIAIAAFALFSCLAWANDRPAGIPEEAKWAKVERVVDGDTIVLIAIAAALISLLLSVFALATRREIAALTEKKKRLEARLVSSPPEIEIEKNEQQAADIERKIASGSETFRMLEEDLAALSPVVEMGQRGLYPPAFDYLDSERLREAVNRNRVEQFALMKRGEAVIKRGTFSLFGSLEDGAALVDDYKKVFLRTFNSEYEDIRKRLRSSNLGSSEEKLWRTAEQLESLGEVLSVQVSQEY